jgi:hypothetical protein
MSVRLLSCAHDFFRKPASVFRDHAFGAGIVSAIGFALGESQTAVILADPLRETAAPSDGSSASETHHGGDVHVDVHVLVGKPVSTFPGHARGMHKGLVVWPASGTRPV